MGKQVFYPSGTFFPVMTKEEWKQKGRPHIIYEDKDTGRLVFTTIEECFDNKEET